MGIKFNKKNHTYKVGKKELMPVSNLLDIFFGKTDMKELARKVNKNPNGKYYKKGVRKILAGWKEVITNGSAVHKELEDYILQGIEVTTPEAELGVQWLNTHLEQPYIEPLLLPETIVYNEELGIAGTIDLIILDENTMRITLVDWKTNEKIDDKQYQKMKIPIEGLQNTKLQRYYMQLNIYAYLLSLKGSKVEEIYLVHITKEKRKVYKVPILTDIAKYMCENYRRFKDE